MSIWFQELNIDFDQIAITFYYLYVYQSTITSLRPQVAQPNH